MSSFVIHNYENKGCYPQVIVPQRKSIRILDIGFQNHGYRINFIKRPQPSRDATLGRYLIQGTPKERGEYYDHTFCFALDSIKHS